MKNVRFFLEKQFLCIMSSFYIKDDFFLSLFQHSVCLCACSLVLSAVISLSLFNRQFVLDIRSISTCGWLKEAPMPPSIPPSIPYPPEVKGITEMDQIKVTKYHKINHSSRNGEQTTIEQQQLATFSKNGQTMANNVFLKEKGSMILWNNMLLQYTNLPISLPYPMPPPPLDPCMPSILPIIPPPP